MRPRQTVFGQHSHYVISDTLWARATVVLAERDASPPDKYRPLLEAMLFRALAGVPWEQLPIDYPPPTEVLACLEDWQQRGVLARLEAVLLIRLGG